jgi:hypothetical protein
VDINERTSSRGNKSLESRGTDRSKKNGDVHSRTLPDALATDGESKAHHSSAVDEVIKTLWSGSSSEDLSDQTTTGLNQKGCAKGIDNYPELPDMAPTEITKSEMASLRPRAPLGAGRDQADSLQPQSPSQEKQVEERGGRGGREPSR